MPEWSGFRNKTLWDWLTILFVPVLIALAAGVFSLISLRSEEQRAQVQLDIEQRRAQAERDIETDRARETALQAYLDRMTELLLDPRLLEADASESVREVARARTITILRSLDAARNRSVLRFLHDADLVDKRGEPRGSSLVSLIDADLSNADLTGSDFHDINLHGAVLSEANLQRTEIQDTNMMGVDLSNVRLQGTNLKGAFLQGADLCGAFLINANLENANLSNALLLNASLRGANLTNAILDGANLSDANLPKNQDLDLCGDLAIVDPPRITDLRGATVTEEQLARAADLVGAIMPDGTEMTEVRWAEFKDSPASD